MWLRRRPPRLDVIFSRYDPPLYFVTISTFRRKAVLASEAVHATFCTFAKTGEDKRIAVGRYVIMPDHLHVFVAGDFNLSQWVRMLKLTLGREARKIKNTELLWERGFFDHLIRSSESYAGKWNYVRQNPVRAGLVTDANDWPFSGEITIIEQG